MPQDANGPTTPLGIPTFNTASDAPSGKGDTSFLTVIDTLLAARVTNPASVGTGDVPVWNGATWIKPTGSRDGTKFLRDDGAWASAIGVPTGAITAFGATSAPSGYVLCDGTSYLRAGAGMDALFAVIGTNYGSADGTHFNVPDFQGRGLWGKGTHADVDAFTDNDGQTLVNRTPKYLITTSPGFAGGGSGAAVAQTVTPAYGVVVWIIKT